MKKFRNVLLVFVLTVLCLSLSACGQEAKEELSYDEIVNVQDLAMSYMESIIALDDVSLDSYIDEFAVEQDTVMQNGLNSWKDSKAELGMLLWEDEPVVELQLDGTIKATTIATFENRDCEFVFAFDERRQKITELTFNPVYSMGEKMSQALVNLAVGMGTVFVVLIFLTFIISSFKYVRKFEERKEAKKSNAAIAETAAAPAEAVPTVESDDDNEIQAVIAAAIAAYESECGGSEQVVFEKKPALNNGIRVRSYKRS